VILIKTSSKNKSDIFKETNSRPEDHIHIRFLTSHGSASSFEVKSIALISVSISSIDKVSGNFLPVLGDSISSKGLSSLRSSKIKYPKKLLRPDMIRAWERGLTSLETAYKLLNYLFFNLNRRNLNFVSRRNKRKRSISKE
jgi:hypothetical protein